MNSAERPVEIKKMFEQFYRYVDENNVEDAERVLNELKDKIGEDDREIAGCNVKLKFLKNRRKK